MRSLCAAAALIMLIGCAPQIAPQAPRPNVPLRIVTRSPAGPLTRFYVDPSCASSGQTFTLGVVDEDEQDVISSLWFVDRDQNPNATPFTTTPNPPGGSTTRMVNAPAAPSFMTTLNALPLGTHLLTVFVADTPFNEVQGQSVTAGPRLILTADGGTTEDPGYVDEFTWVLQVERCP